jgi:hypothetical protein
LHDRLRRDDSHDPIDHDRRLLLQDDHKKQGQHRYQSFGIRHSAFVIRHFSFGIRHSAFGRRPSHFIG